MRRKKKEQEEDGEYGEIHLRRWFYMYHLYFLAYINLIIIEINLILKDIK
jgi:hypothetical protein